MDRTSRWLMVGLGCVVALGLFRPGSTGSESKTEPNAPQRPDVPPLKNNPVFVFYPDTFQKPNPFRPDIAVSIDRVLDKKLDALDTLESQFYEGGALGSADLIPTDPQKQADRRREVRVRHA